MRDRRASADQILQRFDIIEPPVPIDDLVQLLGVRLNYVESPGWSGAVKITPPNRADIWVASEESAVRRRFTIAHEMGHLMLHNPEDEAYRDISFSGSKMEAQANRYAAALLMPLWMLQEQVEIHGPNVSRLADLFDVSEMAMGIRLEKLAGR
jgi:Zn-dependent peptidase ImmA (M78 family)